jgi:hypothetical protein
MTRSDTIPTQGASASALEGERSAALAAVVEDLGAELSLRPLLEHAAVPGGTWRRASGSCCAASSAFRSAGARASSARCVVFSRDPLRVFTPADAELLELFAKHAALAITHSRLHEAAESNTRAEAAAQGRPGGGPGCAPTCRPAGPARRSRRPRRGSGC